MRSFSQKGYRATSIQDIADSLGIAKGSLYFYFKSKEDLLASIIRQHVTEMMEDFWSTVRDTSLSPRERLHKQQMRGFQAYRENKEFIRLLMQERLDLHDQLFELVYAIRYQTLVGIQMLLVEMYGEQSRPYSVDAATIYVAMNNEFMSYIILNLDWIELDERKIAEHTLQRMDDIVQGMITRGNEPLVKPEQLKQMARAMELDKPWKKGMLAELQAVRGLLDTAGLPNETHEEMISSIVMIEEELEREVPRAVLIKGLLSLLKTVRHAEIKKHVAKLEQLLPGSVEA